MTRNFKQKTAPAALGRCVSIRTRFFEAFSGITAQKMLTNTKVFAPLFAYTERKIQSKKI